MPSMRKEIIAILVADLHLSLNAPIWRSAESDWFAAMARPLKEIRAIQAANNDCIILCAGDVFDKWNSPPELINFALKYLPDNMYCIPGQHDLPQHNYEDINKSAYYTLVQAEKIQNILPEVMVLQDERKITLTGFPFGYKIKERGSHTNISFPKTICIALVHEYIWIKGHNYTTAPKENQLSRALNDFINKKLKGYDVIIYGDNHKGFSTNRSNTEIFNCGSLMRRNSDQIDYKPQVGLLYSDGSVKPYYLDITQDKHLDVSKEALGEDTLNMKSFIEELEKLGDTDLDFTEAMNRYLSDNKISMPICNIILKAMGL